MSPPEFENPAANGGGPEDFDFAVARYNFDGSLDTSFNGGIGANGGFRTFLGGGNFEGAEALAIQPDGKLVGGSNDFDFALVRIHTDGRLDTSFGTDGTLRTFFGGNSEGANALVIQADGKLIAAGFSWREGSRHLRSESRGEGQGV